MFDAGSIVINKGFIFENGVIDHVYETGRPCLVIAVNDEYYYYLSLTSTHKSSFKLNGTIKQCFPSYANVFKSPICFKEEKGQLLESELYYIYKSFIDYYKDKEKCEYYDEVIPYINEFMETYYKKVNDRIIEKYKKSNISKR